MASITVNYSNTNNVNDTFTATLSGVADSSHLIWYYRKALTQSNLSSAEKIKFTEIFLDSNSLPINVGMYPSINFRVLDSGTSNLFQFTRTLNAGPSTSTEGYNIITLTQETYVINKYYVLDGYGGYKISSDAFNSSMTYYTNYEILRGYYYLIGVSYNGTADDVLWSTNSALVYEFLPETINTPTIIRNRTLREYTEITIINEEHFNTKTVDLYVKVIGGYEKVTTYIGKTTYYVKTSDTNYNLYYLSGDLNLSWTALNIPDGLSSCWYQLQYVIGNSSKPTSYSSGWQIYGNSLNEISTSGMEININLINAGKSNNSIWFRIIVYAFQDTNSDNVISEITSYSTSLPFYMMNTPYFYSTPKIDGLTVSINPLEDGYRTTSVRPLNKQVKATISADSLINAFTASTNRPMNDIPSTGGPMYTDFKCDVYLSYTSTSTKTIKIYTSEIHSTNNPYWTSNIYYNLLTHYKSSVGTGILNELFGLGDESLINPSEVQLKVIFTDIFDLTLTTSTTVNIAIDFREKPDAPTSLIIGRDALLNGVSSITKTLKSGNSNFFPSKTSTNNIILKDENFLIAFIPGASNYDAEVISDRTYYIEISYMEDFDPDEEVSEEYFNNIIKKSTLLYSSVFNGSDFSIDDDHKIFSIAADSIVEAGYYGCRILCYDPKIPNEKTTLLYSTNFVIGALRKLPTITITNPTHVSDSGEYLIYTKKSSLISHVTINWPQEYLTYALYHRGLGFGDIEYLPNGTLTILYSDSIDSFEPGTQIEYPKGRAYSLYSTVFGGGGSQYPDLLQLIVDKTRVYSRLKLEIATGLEYLNGTVVERKETIYSNIVISYLTLPTISTRAHAIGINDINVRGALLEDGETSDIILTSINEYKSGDYNKTCICLAGSYEEESTVKNIKLYYDISTGLLTDGDTGSESEIFGVSKLFPLKSEIEAMTLV